MEPAGPDDRNRDILLVEQPRDRHCSGRGLQLVGDIVERLDDCAFLLASALYAILSAEAPSAMALPPRVYFPESSPPPSGPQAVTARSSA